MKLTMPRCREVPKREILPDPKFGSVELAKFMNVVMLSGKKAVAERIIYGAFDQIQAKSGKDPIEVFNLAITNIKPVVEVKAVASAVPTIRCMSKYAPCAVWPWPCAGCARPPKSAVKSLWTCAW